MGAVIREQPVLCRSCRAPIVFVKSAKKPEPGRKPKSIPVNAEAAIWVRPRPTLRSLRTVIVTDAGETVTGELVPDGFQDRACKRGRRSHFATCPFGDSYRRRA